MCGAVPESVAMGAQRSTCPALTVRLAAAILTMLTSCTGAPGAPVKHAAATPPPAGPTASARASHGVATPSMPTPPAGHGITTGPAGSTPPPSAGHTPLTTGPARPSSSSRVSHDLRAPELGAVVEPWQLPHALAREVVLVDHRRLVVAGGLAAVGSTTAIVGIDPRTGAAIGAGELTRPVHDAAGVTLGSRHLVLGGGDQATVSTVQEFGSDGSTAVIGRLPRPRSDLVAAVVRSTAYVLAGYDGSATDPGVLATTDGRHFAMIASLPVTVRYPAIAVLGHDIYLFGGEHEGSATTAIQRIDTRTGRAALIGHLARPLAHASAVTLGGVAYLLGGMTGTSAVESIGRFDPAIETVVPAGRLPYPVSDAGVVALAGTAYLVGGENPHPLATVVALRTRQPLHNTPRR